MYKNFTEYWNAKEDVLSDFGVTRVVAKLIWNDALNIVHKLLIPKAEGLQNAVDELIKEKLDLEAELAAFESTKPKVETYTVDTRMGRGYKVLPFLSREEIANADSIGHSGETLKDGRTTVSKYLNSLDRGEIIIEQTRCDHGDFCESFIIIRVS